MEDGMDEKIYVNTFLVLTFFYFFSIGFDARADSLRCSSKVVSTGDNASIVKEKCGEPISIMDMGSETTTQTRTTFYRGGGRAYRKSEKSVSKSKAAQDWRYCIRIPYTNKCKIYILRFENNILKKVTYTQSKRRLH